MVDLTEFVGDNAKRNEYVKKLKKVQARKEKWMADKIRPLEIEEQVFLECIAAIDKGIAAKARYDSEKYGDGPHPDPVPFIQPAAPAQPQQPPAPTAQPPAPTLPPGEAPPSFFKKSAEDAANGATASGTTATGAPTAK